MKSLQSLTQIRDIDDLNDNRNQSLHATIVSIHEAESIVASLQEFPVDAIGCSPFMKMYGYDMERLSQQAHVCAMRQDGDEYVVESILTHKKLGVLIKTLLAIEAWRTLVLFAEGKEVATSGDGSSSNDSTSSCNEKKEDEIDTILTTGITLAERLAENKSSLRCALILHVETAICSLINLILFRKENVEEMDNDCCVALVDYCARQMASLAIPIKDNPMVQRQRYMGTVEEKARYIQNRSILDEIRDNLLDSEFKTAVVATSVARYLCEHIDILPISAQTRILDTHDYLQMMVPLIDEPPWTRRRRISNDKGEIIVWEKLFDNHEWRKVAPNELLQITKYEAQCWIAVFYLTCGSVCRQRYGLNVYRKEHLLRLRKYLNEVMVEQLPVLTDVMRYMDELALMNVPEMSTGQGSTLLMQQVDKLRDDILRNQNWRQLAEKQYRTIFSQTTDAEDEDIRLLGSLYDDEFLGTFLDHGGDLPLENKVLALPVTMITLSSGSIEDVYNLTPAGDEEIVMHTAQGELKRMKLKLHCPRDEPFLFGKELSLKAIISVNQIEKYKTLSLDTCLSEDIKKTQWIQMGRTEEDGYALQLSFKLDSTTHLFELRQAFLSQPL